MSRTKGHTGSRHTYWKHQSSHSSNKLNKKDSHQRRRTELHSTLNRISKTQEGIPSHDIDDSCVPSYNRNKAGGCGGWF